MESLMESGVLWSLLLEQGCQPSQWHLLKVTEVPADAELCGWRGSEEIPAVSVQPPFSMSVWPFCRARHSRSAMLPKGSRSDSLEPKCAGKIGEPCP